MALSAKARADIRRRLRQRADEFLQRFYRHDTLTARAVRGVELEIAQQFRREVARPLVASIAAGLANFTERGQDITPDNSPELRALIRESEAIVERGVATVRRLARERMQDIGDAEAEFVAENASKTVDKDVGGKVKPKDVAKKPFLGDKHERWFAKMLTGPTADAVRQRITLGIQQGLTVDQLVSSIRGSATQPGVLAAGEQAVATLVRTASTSASSQARVEAFEALGVERWRFIATLDNKTSVICAANDGKTFPVGEGPMPPLHPNCRSTAVPDFGDKPAGTRASIDGQVPASQDYAVWLAKQSNAEQDQVLGTTKAKAWRTGQLTLKQMLGRDLQPLTLAELRRLDRL